MANTRTRSLLLSKVGVSVMCRRDVFGVDIIKLLTAELLLEFQWRTSRQSPSPAHILTLARRICDPELMSGDGMCGGCGDTVCRT